MNAIELSHVTKHFPGFTLQDLSLTVPSGTICGLVGENGAGKSILQNEEKPQPMSRRRTII